MLQVLITFKFLKFLVFITMNQERDKDRLIAFGKQLKTIREELKLSQDDVAASCDVTKGNLSNIENGKKDFTFTTLLEIAKGLGIDPKDLLNFKKS